MQSAAHSPTTHVLDAQGTFYFPNYLYSIRHDEKGFLFAANPASLMMHLCLNVQRAEGR